MLVTLFWIALLLGLYPYVIYPVLVSALGRLSGRSVRASESFTPTVTVITAAFNEARHIEATVRNKLAQDYPPDQLEMLIVSDGSDDGTDEVVRRLVEEDFRVRLIRQIPRQGKTAALNCAVAAARGEILVFADANSMYRTDTVRRLASNFADPSVGYVTGNMLYVDREGSLVGDGCSAYMRYENHLRAAETRVGSIVGVDGGVDAVRRRLYVPMTPDQLPDFVLPLAVVEQGYRVVYDSRAVLTEDTLATYASEYRMRVRVSLRAFWSLWQKRQLLNPLRFGVFSWQLLSHKLLRYLSFLPLALAVLISGLLWGEGLLYQLIVLGECAFALLILGAVRAPQTIGAWAPARYGYYFFLLNWAAAVAFSRFLRGERQVLWTPRVG